MSTRICPDNERPLAQVLRREHVPDEPSWHDAVEKTLQLLCDREEEISDNGAVSSVHPSISKVRQVLYILVLNTTLLFNFSHVYI